VGFTNPYPSQHATGGATWIPDPTADVGGSSLPAPEPRLRLESVWPNPASGPAELVFHQVEAGPVRVEIVDVTGRMVAARAAGDLAAGRHTFRWDGRDRSGAAAAAGAYFVRVSGGGASVTRTILVVR